MFLFCSVATRELGWLSLPENNYQLNMTFIGYHSLRKINKCVVYEWGRGDGLYFETFHIVYYS